MKNKIKTKEINELFNSLKSIYKKNIDLLKIRTLTFKSDSYAEEIREILNSDLFSGQLYELSVKINIAVFLYVLDLFPEEIIMLEVERSKYLESLNNEDIFDINTSLYKFWETKVPGSSKKLKKFAKHFQESITGNNNNNNNLIEILDYFICHRL